jgi:hypothetical protein
VIWLRIFATDGAWRREQKENPLKLRKVDVEVGLNPTITPPRAK